jgi:hypothetical protein
MNNLAKGYLISPWTITSGTIWLTVGLGLSAKGFSLLYPFNAWTAVWIVLAFGIGFLKARFVLSKRVHKTVLYLRGLGGPIRFRHVFSPSYIVLIGAMVGLGMAMRWMPISPVLRGGIDLAIGFALMQGSILYFRAMYGSS